VIRRGDRRMPQLVLVMCVRKDGLPLFLLISWHGFNRGFQVWIRTCCLNLCVKRRPGAQPIGHDREEIEMILLEFEASVMLGLEWNGWEARSPET
jgi:hypothetical protein